MAIRGDFLSFISNLIYGKKKKLEATHMPVTFQDEQNPQNLCHHVNKYNLNKDSTETINTSASAAKNMAVFHFQHLPGVSPFVNHSEICHYRLGCI